MSLAGLQRTIGRIARRYRVEPFTWLATTVLALVVLNGAVLVPQWLARAERFQVLRDHVEQIARLAASSVDGDAHRALAGRFSETAYQQVVAPLVRLHQASPEIFYLYTMVERDGIAHFVVDTAAAPTLNVPHQLVASDYLEPFSQPAQYGDEWLRQLGAGLPYVNPNYQHDEYGYFMSGHAPIFDGSGGNAGFVGVDFDINYYLAQERRFAWISWAGVVLVVPLAILFGFAAARHLYRLKHRILLHQDAALRDDLTGLLNRRGARRGVASSRQARGGPQAVILIDVDDFKSINDTYGHVTGDEVLTALAEAIRHSVRETDVVARMGGDEFLIYAPDSDPQVAREVANRILHSLLPDRGGESLAAAGKRYSGFSVSIGISTGQADTDFDTLYRRADEALYQAKAGGKNRYRFFREPG